MESWADIRHYVSLPANQHWVSCNQSLSEAGPNSAEPNATLVNLNRHLLGSKPLRGRCKPKVGQTNQLWVETSVAARLTKRNAIRFEMELLPY